MPVCVCVIVCIPHTMLITNSVPRGVVEDQVLHTTSHYPLRQAETTQEETAAPGKLPETPLRMEPGVLYEDAPQEKINPDDLLPDVPLRQPHSSYNVRSLIAALPFLEFILRRSSSGLIDDHVFCEPFY